jgi:endonuclease YncB( thermonuclease family)
LCEFLTPQYRKPVKRTTLIPLLVISHLVALSLGYLSARLATMHDVVSVTEPRGAVFDKVLDGDTVVKDGVAYHVRGIDAAELGPWAKCWAEAALAGFSKNYLERTLLSGTWSLVDPHADKAGRMSARLLDAKGYDIADTMHVYGGAAETDQRWNWCGADVPLRPTRYDDKPPAGPELWWPSNDVYDPRADD